MDQVLEYSIKYLYQVFNSTCYDITRNMNTGKTALHIF